jgi:hypothetical protein
MDRRQRRRCPTARVLCGIVLTGANGEDLRRPVEEVLVQPLVGQVLHGPRDTHAPEITQSQKQKWHHPCQSRCNHVDPFSE